MDRHYDLIHSIKCSGNVLQEIWSCFCNRHRFMEDMVMFVRQSRWSDLHPLAHKLKSSVTMLGMTGLAPLAEIERTSKFGGNPSTLPQLVSDLTSQMEVVCRAISQDLSEAMVLNASPQRVCAGRRNTPYLSVLRYACAKASLFQLSLEECRTRLTQPSLQLR